MQLPAVVASLFLGLAAPGIGWAEPVITAQSDECAVDCGGGTCCPSGYFCTSDGQCCPDDTYETPDGACCPYGTYSSLDGYCIPDGNPYCGDGKYCGPGKTIVCRGICYDGAREAVEDGCPVSEHIVCGLPVR